MFSAPAKGVSCYADIIAMRHPKEGAPMRASMVSGVPIINAGDGGHKKVIDQYVDSVTLADLVNNHEEKCGKLDL